MENLTINRSVELKNIELFQAIQSGFSKDQKSIPPKFFYDQYGSEIFEEICSLKEYYPTRTEIEILKSHGRSMAKLLGPGSMIIEPGSGAAEKVRYLLPHLACPTGYVPIEISKEILLRTVLELQDEFPKLPIYPVCQDFSLDIKLPEEIKNWEGRKTIFFPGSTIGNMAPLEAREFLLKLGDLVGEGGTFLIGVDTRKEPSLLKKAYDDSLGVTARFNLNLLRRINREVSADFDLNNFMHEAFFNEDFGRVEMHLVSLKEQIVKIHDRQFTFRQGESIHTESSYKYDVDEFCTLAFSAGLKIREWWQDPEKLFCIYYFEKE